MEDPLMACILFLLYAVFKQDLTGEGRVTELLLAVESNVFMDDLAVQASPALRVLWE